MRITNQSIDEFLESLADVTTIFDSTIRVSINRRSAEQGNPRTAAKNEVVIQASTVVNVEDGGEYLLDVGESCGMDYNDATQDKNGSNRAAELKDRIKKFASTKGWRVLPGMISE